MKGIIQRVMRFNRIKDKLYQNRWFLLLAIVLWGLISYSMYLDYNREWTIAQNQAKYGFTYNKTTNEENNKVAIPKETEVTLNFIIESKKFTGFSLWFEADETLDRGKVTVELFDKISGKRIQKWKMRYADIGLGGFTDFKLSKRIDASDGIEYVIKVRTNTSENAKYYLGLSDATNDTENFSTINNKKTNSFVAFRLMVGTYGVLRWLALAFYFGMTLLIITVAIMFVSEMKLEWIFVVFTLILGLMHLYALPPNSAPDEMTHFITTYAHSSNLLGKQAFDEEGNVILENERLWGEGDKVPTKATYEKYLRATFGQDYGNTDTAYVTREPLEMRHLGYTPQVIGVSVARLLDLNCELLFLCGELFALLWYVFIMFWAIRWMPIAKVALFVIGTLPMTMQIVVSYNYDSVLFGVCFLTIAHLMNLIYREKEVGFKDVLFLSICSFMIAAIKFVYLPILGIGLFIPKERFGSNRNKILAIIWLMLLSVATLLYIKAPVIFNLGVERTTISANPGEAYTISYLLEHPVGIFNMFYRTIRVQIFYYISLMLASPLGWVEIWLPNSVVLGYCIMIMASIAFEQKEHIATVGLKVFCAVATFGMGLLVLFALLMDFTNVGSDIIGGVQGRYFIHFLPMVAVAMQSNVLSCTKNVDKYLILFLSYLECTSIAYIALYVIAR